MSFAVILLLSFFGLQAQAQTDIVTWTFDGNVSTTATGTGTAVGDPLEAAALANGANFYWIFAYRTGLSGLVIYV